MKSVDVAGIRMIALMIFICPFVIAQEKTPDKAPEKEVTAEAKSLPVSITLKSGEVVTGLLVKIDNNSVEFKVKGILQSIPTREVSHVRFGETTAAAPKNDTLYPRVDPPSLPGPSDPASGPTGDVIGRKPVDPSAPTPMSANLKPTILYKEKAKYTQEARDNGVEGTVVLNVVFAADGTISQIRVVRALPDGLTEKAIEAARKIRFQPAIKDGQPVSVRGNLEYTFILDPPLPAPTLHSPQPDAVIDVNSQRTTLEWLPVPGARKYKIRIEKESPKPGQWALVLEQEVIGPNYYTFDPAGAEVWRWRVTAVNLSGNNGRSSDWRIFRIKK